MRSSLREMVIKSGGNSRMIMERFLNQWNLKSSFKDSKDLTMGVTVFKNLNLIRTLPNGLLQRRGLLHWWYGWRGYCHKDITLTIRSASLSRVRQKSFSFIEFFF